MRQDELLYGQEPSSRGGAHSRAHAVLETPRGNAITAALGLGPAGSAGACLGCHATPAGTRGDRSEVSAGVRRESCHGPTAGW
ncbi:MAG TPA: multiheme c-type cytochrome, partial [Novosphingobium sp.]|nr:multiheme c-type cytochrome [Novosphingobium sp.]